MPDTIYTQYMPASYGESHKFCTACGSTIRYRKVVEPLEPFDQRTGEPRYILSWECSRNNLYWVESILDRLSGTWHTEFFTNMPL